MDEIIKMGIPEFAKEYFPVSFIGVALSFYGAALCAAAGRYAINSRRKENEYLQSILEKLG